MANNPNITYGDIHFNSTGGMGITAAVVHTGGPVQVHHHQYHGNPPPAPAKSPYTQQQYECEPPYRAPDYGVPSRKKSAGDPIPNAVAQFVANHIGPQWRQLGLVLELKDHDLDNIAKDNEHSGIVETAYQMLRKWRERYFQYATSTVLEDALLSIGRVDIYEKMNSNFQSRN